jgi:hypothetical protein
MLLALLTSSKAKKNLEDAVTEIMTLQLTFKPSGAANFDLEIDSTATVADVKAKCADLCGIEKDAQKIIFKGMLICFMNHHDRKAEF